MKKITLFISVLALAITCKAQSREEVDAVVNRFRNFYNSEQTDSIYEMMSERSKGMLPLDKAKQIFTQTHAQLGELKSYEFTKEVEKLSCYKAEFANATLSLLVSLNDRNKMETFRFIAYKEDSTPKEQSNIFLKTRTGNVFGSLTLPEGTKKVPVVLIIAGSGPTDRNCNSDAGGMNTNAYKLLADSLQKAGIAAVRYDKRGVGESAGAAKSEDSTTFGDMVDDAVGFIKMLKKDARFSKIIIAGHSEGSLIGMIAAQREQVAGFISIAGIAQRADKVIEKQLRAQSGDLAAQATIILDSLDAGHKVKSVDPELYILFRPSIQPYMISWLKFAPAKEIKKLAIPVLIVQGTTDTQVDVSEAEQLKKAYPKATLKIIDGMNHPMKQAPEDRQKNAATYNNPKLPLSPGLMPAIVEFINTIK
jgi:hypothetical protein